MPFFPKIVYCILWHGALKYGAKTFYLFSSLETSLEGDACKYLNLTGLHMESLLREMAYRSDQVSRVIISVQWLSRSRVIISAQMLFIKGKSSQ